ncbi:PKD domain-containing protein, partial [Vibrio fluvialis]|nr:PKD domain-containing protein [Vibrio fluvialis]
MRLESADGDVLEDVSLIGNANFADGQDYSSPLAPDSGRLLTEFGLQIDIVNQSQDNEFGVVRLSRANTANVPPTANFELDVNGLSVNAHNHSQDSDGELASYAWDFGNGETSDAMAPSWHYDAAGTYTVRLTVTDDQGESDTVTQTITVVQPNLPPQASARYVHLGRWVTMWSTSSDSDGRIVDTEWTLPNGKIKRGRVFTAILPRASEQAVTLKVMDDDGASTTTTISLDL